MMNLSDYIKFPEEESKRWAERFEKENKIRNNVREFSDEQLNIIIRMIPNKSLGSLSK